MKKLMLLGGSKYLLPVIKTAHEMGLYVITCDYLPDNVAHKFSDEYKNVDITDRDATLRIAQEINIDGIMSFACDPGVVTAAYIADYLGLPSVGPYESVCILQNKARFRKLLTEHCFNVPTVGSYTSICDALSDSSKFHWPIIVKPTDSAGSKGVTKVSDPEKLKEAIKVALSFSKRNEFIIEDFIQQQGCSSDSDCFSIDGILGFTSFSSQRFDCRAENPYVPAAFSWPSTMAVAKQKELTNELQRLLNILKMGTALYNVETRIGIDGKSYIMEVSPRGGGNRLSECIKCATGVDLIKGAVQAALNMPITDIEQRDCNGYWAEIILHGNKNGRLKNIWIANEIMPNIIGKNIDIPIGAMIYNFSSANKAIGTMILRFESIDHLECVISNIEKYVKVIVE